MAEDDLPFGVQLREQALQLIEKKGLKIWRTGRDSNPRYAKQGLRKFEEVFNML